MVNRDAEGRDTWYVDLVTIEEDGNRYTCRDLYIDVMVPMDGRHHRMLDLDEFANAVDDGSLGIEQATDALRRWQRFLDRHLHAQAHRQGVGRTSRRQPSSLCSRFRRSAIRSGGMTRRAL